MRNSLQKAKASMKERGQFHIENANLSINRVKMESSSENVNFFFFFKPSKWWWLNWLSISTFLSFDIIHRFSETWHYQANTNSKFIQKTKKGALPHTGSISTHYLLNESYVYPSNQNRILSSLDLALAKFIGHFTKWSSCNKYFTIFSRVKKHLQCFNLAW